MAFRPRASRIGRKSRVITRMGGLGTAMKVQDFAYQVAAHTMELLEQGQHYKIPEDTRKEVIEKVLADIDEILKKSS